MLATTVQCPFCSHQYQTKRPVAAGKRLLCSHCGRSFNVPASSPPPMPATHVESSARTEPDLDMADAPPAPGKGIYPPPHLPNPPRAGLRLASADEQRGAAPAPPPRDATVGPASRDAAVGPASRRSMRGAVWAGVILGGLVVLVGATIALAVHFAGKKEPPPGAATGAVADRSGQPASTDPSAPARPTSRQLASASAEDVPLSARLPSPSGRNSPSPVDLPSDLRLPDPSSLATGAPTRGVLTAAEQKLVNQAIDEGVAYLKKHQTADGTWGGRRVGYAALPGLTLLECGVPASDPAVQKAAAYVRQQCPKLNTTYDLGLGILFLDHLGDRSDEGRIRSMALRLIAGQSDTGGWTYDCGGVLQPKEERDLFVLLDDLRPSTPLDLFVPGSDEAPPGLIASKSTEERPGLIAEQPGQRPLGLFLPKARPELDHQGGDTIPLEPRQPAGKPARKPGELSPQGQRALNTLSRRLHTVPALVSIKGKKPLPKRDNRHTDNSNTQFATLGLWVAARHGVPTERALALIGRRFRVSQQKDGSWWYYFPMGGAHTEAMTGAGLLGLAVAHGLTGGAAPGSGKRQVTDPAIDRGLHFLGTYIGTPQKKPVTRHGHKIGTPKNLYLMWSVERVGMLYGLRKIAGKDWYHWGVELLLDAQNNDGGWHGGIYPGSAPIPDTSFALLFLKRANFTQEISQSLEFFVQGKGMHDNR